MIKDEKIDWKPIWWTTAITTLAVVVTDGFARLVEKNMNAESFRIGRGIFIQNAPEYFPLVFLAVVFIASFLTIWIYRLILPNLPKNIWIRGILVGLAIYFIAYLPPVVYVGFTIRVPSSISVGRAINSLLNCAINGCIMSYCYYRFSSDYKTNQGQ